MRGLIRKSVIFFENMDDDHSPQVASPIPPAMVEFGRFGTLADGRPIRLGGRAFDVLMALIEASRAVVSKHELLSRVWQGRNRRREPAVGHRITALRKGL
jgi:DNA-binding response OmpR family regulator